MLKAIVYKLKPKKEQEQHLLQSFWSCRFVYNRALSMKIEAYKKDKTSLSAYDIMKELTQLKRSEWYERLWDISINSLQSSISNMERAYRWFFKHWAWYPKFKSKHTSRKSFHIKAWLKVNYDWNGLWIPKLWRVKFFKDKQIQGDIRNATVFAEADWYYISIVYDDWIESVETESQSFVWVDVWIKDFAILSNGSVIKNPRYFVSAQEKLRLHQRKLSRMEKRSNNRQKQVIIVKKHHLKVRRQREDFLHKESTIISRDYDCVCLEDLNIKWMVKNRRLSKHISDVWRWMFWVMLSYKCNEVQKIGRFQPSSKLCSACSRKNTELKLSDRKRTCWWCWIEHDRDVNAAINILERGKTLRASETSAKVGR